MKKFLIALIFFLSFIPVFPKQGSCTPGVIYPAFSQKKEIQDEQSDFMSDKKINLELGISGFMLQGKVIFLLNEKINPFIRFGFGGVAKKNTELNSTTGFDAETGIKYNLVVQKNSKKALLNNIYLKFFAGATKNLGSGLAIYPFSGVGAGLNSVNKSLGFSMGIDLGSTFEYSKETGLGGIIFLRPEINIEYVF